MDEGMGPVNLLLEHNLFMWRMKMSVMFVLVLAKSRIAEDDSPVHELHLGVRTSIQAW